LERNQGGRPGFSELTRITVAGQRRTFTGFAIVFSPSGTKNTLIAAYLLFIIAENKQRDES
jgi:hypothetical protein